MSDLSLQAALRAMLPGAEEARRFVLAGNATVTLVSRRTLQRFTFKFARPRDSESAERPVWVKLLSGPDNESGYSFVGTLFHPKWNEVKLSRKSRVGTDAASFHAVQWFLFHLFHERGNPAAMLEQMEVWHEGRCGRCGRKLTVPSSIAAGIGPECAGRM